MACPQCCTAALAQHLLYSSRQCAVIHPAHILEWFGSQPAEGDLIPVVRAKIWREWEISLFYWLLPRNRPGRTDPESNLRELLHFRLLRGLHWRQWLKRDFMKRWAKLTAVGVVCCICLPSKWGSSASAKWWKLSETGGNRVWSVRVIKHLVSNH